jgi:hypothetical protein
MRFGIIPTIEVMHKNIRVVIIRARCKEPAYSILLKYGYNVKDIEAKKINHNEWFNK